jgi:hypothetical protein
MTKSDKVKIDLDDRLADFTDRVLSGEPNTPVSPSEKELLRLEETVLRLDQSFPQHAMDERTIKRMQADFNMRRRAILPRARPALWWSQQTRQRVGLALAVIAVIVAVFVIVPFLASGGDILASAGLHPQSIGLLVFILGGVLLLAVWLGRRK